MVDVEIWRSRLSNIQSARVWRALLDQSTCTLIKRVDLDLKLNFSVETNWEHCRVRHLSCYGLELTKINVTFHICTKRMWFEQLLKLNCWIIILFWIFVAFQLIKSLWRRLEGQSRIFCQFIKWHCWISNSIHFTTFWYQQFILLVSNLLAPHLI